MTDSLIPVTTEAALEFLTEGLLTPPDKRELLRPSLELALRNLGHDQASIDKALDSFTKRQVH